MGTSYKKKGNRGQGVTAKGRSRKSGPFVMVREDMQASRAWRWLMPPARCLWIELERRRKGREESVALSVREAAQLLNVGTGTASRAFQQLIEAGFLRVTENAGFNMKSGRRARRFRLTHAKYRGQPPKNEWKMFCSSTEETQKCKTSRTEDAR